MSVKRAYKGRTKSLKYGVGIVPYDYKANDKETGWYCPYMRRWNSVLQRCFGESMAESRPTYSNVSMTKEWYDFLTFKEWMMSQDWDGNDLDKDVLSVLTGVKEYSPENCAFISRELNSFFTLRHNHRGLYPLGVTYCKRGLKNYVARLNRPEGRNSLGCYTTPEEAHKAWQLAKWKYGQELLQEQTDPRVIQAMHVILHKLGEDWSAGRITEKLV